MWLALLIIAITIVMIIIIIMQTLMEQIFYAIYF